MREKYIKKLQATNAKKIQVAAELNALQGEERLLMNLIKEIDNEKMEAALKSNKEKLDAKNEAQVAAMNLAKEVVEESKSE